MKYAIKNNFKYLYITKDSQIVWIDIKEIATHYNSMKEALEDAKKYGGIIVKIKNKNEEI